MSAASLTTTSRHLHQLQQVTTPADGWATERTELKCACGYVSSMWAGGAR